MKGKILDFVLIKGEGVISGDDGKRYTFQVTEWKSQAHPTVGARIDFDVNGNSAVSVYFDAPARRTPAGGPVNSVTDDGMDERYKSIYCSSDDKILVGFCGGLAHKFSLPSPAMRVIVFISLFFFIGWFYFVGIFLPKLPTKNIPLGP